MSNYTKCTLVIFTGMPPADVFKPIVETRLSISKNKSFGLINAAPIYLLLVNQRRIRRAKRQSQELVNLSVETTNQSVIPSVSVSAAHVK